MKQFESLTDIPKDVVFAPTVFHAPRPDTKAIGVFKGRSFYRPQDVTPLHTEDDWRRQRRKIKPGAKPLRYRGIDRLGVFAEWQTEQAS